MKEKPILMSAPMVRAILENRKSQTRRVVKPQPSRAGLRLIDDPITTLYTWKDDSRAGGPERYSYRDCTYGKPGGRLWVRETWAVPSSDPLCGRIFDKKEVAYAADAPLVDIESPAIRWRPSIHMPRWASRITLEVTDIRVERVQDISAVDALAEGVGGDVDSSQVLFASLWDRINGKPRKDGVDISWAANPFVWVVEFRKTEAN
jgi:hypothetical protein